PGEHHRDDQLRIAHWRVPGLRVELWVSTVHAAARRSRTQPIYRYLSAHGAAVRTWSTRPDEADTYPSPGPAAVSDVSRGHRAHHLSREHCANAARVRHLLTAIDGVSCNGARLLRDRSYWLRGGRGHYQGVLRDAGHANAGDRRGTY